jgi:hypothetical protein
MARKTPRQPKNSPRGRRKTGASASALPGRRGEKAQAVRQSFAKLGPEARPRDVAADLLQQGIAVTRAQISLIRKQLRTGARTERVGRQPLNSKSAVALVSVEQLVTARRLADELGGVEAARRLLDILLRLQ